MTIAEGPMVLPTALVPERGTGLAGARTWATIPDDERRRRAVAACQEHNAAALWELTDAWLTLHGRAGARVSAHTRGNYRRGVAALVTAWRQETLLRPRRDAGALWLREMEDAGLAPATIKVRLAAARALYAALRWAGATEHDPLRDARPARDPVPPWEKRQPYSDGEVAALLAHAGGSDRVLVLLGAHAGLRVSEMLALQWSDVNLNRGELRVRRGKPRTVALSGTLTTVLRGAAGAAPCGYVLPYRTRVQAWRRLSHVCARAGVDAKGVHSLRHCAGTRIVKETQSLEEAARHLGHASIETTRAYAKWSDARLKATVGAW